MMKGYRGGGREKEGIEVDGKGGYIYNGER